MKESSRSPLLLRLGLTALLAGAAAASGAGIANATTFYGSTHTNDLGPASMHYQHRSQLDDVTNRASMNVWMASGANVTPGYAGGAPVLIKVSTGAVCTSRSMVYNSSSINRHYVPTSGGFCGAGNYQGDGEVDLWNGVSYQRRGTLPTPYGYLS